MKSSKTHRLVVILLILLLIAAGAVGFLLWNKTNDSSENAGEAGIGLENNIVVDDPETLQERYDAMVAKAKEGYMTLEMKTSAFSDDGKNFSCYLGNAIENNYDMYLIITLDETQEELYRSGLIPLGARIETFESAVKLEPGSHTATVTFIRLEEDQKEIHSQVNVGLELVVRG